MMFNIVKVNTNYDVTSSKWQPSHKNKFCSFTQIVWIVTHLQSWHHVGFIRQNKNNYTAALLFEHEQKLLSLDSAKQIFVNIYGGNIRKIGTVSPSGMFLGKDNFLLLISMRKTFFFEGQCCKADRKFKDDEYNNDAQFHAKVGTQSQTANLATDSRRQQRTKSPNKINSLSEQLEANNMDH